MKRFASQLHILPALAAILLFGACAAQASGYTWTGGAGATWDTTDNNWGGSGSITLWDVSAGIGNIAIYNTIGATPVISGTVYCNGITFSQTATISGGTINLTGTAPTVIANTDATISSIIDGSSGLTKTGTGILTLSATNVYTGRTIINAGTVSANTLTTTTTTLGAGSVSIGTNSTLNISHSNANAPAINNTFTGAGTLRLIWNTNNQTITMNNVTGFTGNIQLSRTAANTGVWAPANNTYPAALIVDDGISFGAGSSLAFSKGITTSTSRAISLGGILGGNITLLANTTFRSGVTANSGGAMVTGDITSGSVSGTQILYMFDGSDYRESETFSGNISDGTTGGKISIQSNSGGNDHLAILTGINTYTGETRGNMGILRANDGMGLPAGSLLNITGRHSFETSANLVRAAGSGAGQMQLNGNVGQTDGANGFNAVGAPVVICFGTLGNPAPLTWGSGYFQPTINTLALNKTWSNVGGYTSTIGNTIELRNPMDLGSSARSILVDYNIATLSGVLSGTSGGLTKTGNGTLVLANTTNTYTGVTTIGIGSTLEVKKLDIGGNTSSIGMSSSAAANLVFGSLTTGTRATLRYTGTGELTDRLFLISAPDDSVQPTFDSSGSGAISFSNTGSITWTPANYNKSTVLTLTGNNAGDNALAAAIPDRTASGITSVTKNGPGKWILSGTNTYTGATTINAGILQWNSANNLSGNLAVSAGGNFSLADGTARTISTPVLNLAALANLTFDWNGAAVDQLISTAAATTVAGNVGININPVNSPSGSGITLISAPGGLNTATYFLANNTNFTATLSQSDTAITIGNYNTATALANAFWKGGQVTGAPGSMALSSDTTCNWASDASGTPANGVVPGSPANVFFSTTTGAAQQNAVTLGADMTINSLTFNDSSAVTLAGGSHYLTLRATTDNGNTASNGITVSSSANTTNTIISANVVLGAAQTWTIASGRALTVSGVVSGPSAGSLTVAGGGTVTLSGNPNAFTGAITINAGILKMGAAGALGNTFIYTSGVTVSGNGAALDLGSYSPTAPFSLTLNGTGISGNGALINSGTVANYYGLLTLGSDSSIIASGGGIFIQSPAIITGPGFGLTLGGASNSGLYSILGTGSGTLTKNGTSTWTLYGNNTYTGGTTINAGTLAAGNAAAFGQATNAFIAFGPGSTGKLQLNGNNVTLIGLNTDPASPGMASVESGSGSTGMDTLTVNNVSSNIFAGVFRNGSTRSLALTKGASGIFTLTGTNTYTGPTTINAGTLQLGNGGTSGSIDSSSGVLNNGSLAFNRTDNLTFNLLVSGTGGLTQRGSGTVYLTATNSYTGDTRIDAGILGITNACLSTSAAVYIAAGSTLALNFAGTNTICSLYLGGNQKSPGLYGYSLSPPSSGFFSGTGFLMVTNGPGLQGTVLFIR